MAGLRKCFRCPAEVIIAVTENGKSMPVDPDPNPSGNVVFTGEMKLDSSGRMRDAVIVLGKAASPHDARTHFMPHWATCTGIKRSTKKPGHTCHARGCKTKVPPAMLMCARHWKMVPKQMQEAVWSEYVQGQESRMDPSPRYLEVTAEAIEFVAALEAKPVKEKPAPQGALDL